MFMIFPHLVVLCLLLMLAQLYMSWIALNVPVIFCKHYSRMVLHNSDVRNFYEENIGLQSDFFREVVRQVPKSSLLFCGAHLVMLWLLVFDNDQPPEFAARLRSYNESMQKDEAVLLKLILAYYEFRSSNDLKMKEVVANKRPVSFMRRWHEAGNNIRSFAKAAQNQSLLSRAAGCLYLTASTAADLTAALLMKDESLFALWEHYIGLYNRKLVSSGRLRDFGLDIRPLLMTVLCLAPPTAIMIMVSQFFQTAFSGFLPKKELIDEQGNKLLVLSQCVDDSGESKPTSFFHSPWFNVVAILPFLIGIPGAISAWIYTHMGIDPLFGCPSKHPQFHFVISDIEFYLMPLAWALSALFFRSYFTLAWNFTSSEYDIEISSESIKQQPFKGWWLDMLTMRVCHAPAEIRWSEVQSVAVRTDKFPEEDIFKNNPMLFKVARIGGVFDSLARKLDTRTDYLDLEASKAMISIRLRELNTKQKLDLYCAIREYAPSIHLNEDVQRELLGSTVMSAPQFTQIWFSILMDRDEDCSDREQILAGQTLKNGEYKILSVVASGGQAVVYLAEQMICKNDGAAGSENSSITTGTESVVTNLESNKSVAEQQQLADFGRSKTVILKEWQLIGGESASAKIESAKPVENECAVLSRLSHPSIVKQLDLFYQSGRVYLVLEHIEGMTLRELVAKCGNLPVSRVLDLTRQLCDVLQYLHGQIPPLVHRDFTPENIIIQDDGRIKLIDFSIAESKTEKQKRSECAGKHAFTPPEQFRGEACPASDIYALGATIYFLLTGKEPEPITESNLSGYEVPDFLDRIVRTATALELDKRYDSVDWLLAELNSATAQVAKNDFSSNAVLPDSKASTMAESSAGSATGGGGAETEAEAELEAAADAEYETGADADADADAFAGGTLISAEPASQVIELQKEETIEVLSP